MRSDLLILLICLRIEMLSLSIFLPATNDHHVEVDLLLNL